MKVGDRVELHPGLDDWMRGDRFGEVRKITTRRVRKPGFVLTHTVERVHVLLDKSRRVKAYPRDRLTEIA